jgi:hypothetical protein
MTHPAPDAPPLAPVAQFYGSVVDDAAELLEADEVQGVDRELSLLRVRFRKELLASPQDHALMLKSIETIAKVVSARYRMSKKRTDDLAGGIADVLARMTDVLLPPDMDEGG